MSAKAKSSRIPATRRDVGPSLCSASTRASSRTRQASPIRPHLKWLAPTIHMASARDESNRGSSAEASGERVHSLRDLVA